MAKVVILLTFLFSFTVNATMVTVIQRINPKLSHDVALHYAKAIVRIADMYDMDPKVVAGLIAVETKFDNTLVGKLGEVGLMQIRPEYHSTFIEDLNLRREYLAQAEMNILSGVKYLHYLREVFYPVYGDYRFIEHYNQGPNRRPKKFSYYNKVMQYYHQFGGDSAS
jgi:soluble lytic murein transglycosylase